MKKWPILISVIILIVLLAACNLQRTTSPDGEIPRLEAIENNISDDNTRPTVTPPKRISEETPAVAADPVAKPTETISLLSSETDISVTPEEILLPEPNEPPSQPSITETPIPLPQPTDAPAEPRLAIDHFRSNVEESDPGQTITLEWATSNAITVTLWKLAPTGQFSHFWNVDSDGTFNYAIDKGERNRATFALSAVDSMGHSEMATVAVKLHCMDEWFFTNPPEVCPVTTALHSRAAVQQFERGYMIWIEQEERIYILYSDGLSPKWSAFDDEWDPGEPDRDPALVTPSGFYQPVRGFGLVWREQPSVGERLGWAIDEETAYVAALQRSSYPKYNETYIQALDGAVWRLLAERSGWELTPG
jgi:hypothetical protein